MTTKDPRWKQRFCNYKNALARLSEAINIFAADSTLSGVSADLMQEGLIALSSKLDESLLPYTFDLSLFGQLKNEELIDRIKRCGIVVYEK